MGKIKVAEIPKVFINENWAEKANDEGPPKLSFLPTLELRRTRPGDNDIPEPFSPSKKGIGRGLSLSMRTNQGLSPTMRSTFGRQGMATSGHTPSPSPTLSPRMTARPPPSLNQSRRKRDPRQREAPVVLNPFKLTMRE